MFSFLITKENSVPKPKPDQSWSGCRLDNCTCIRNFEQILCLALTSIRVVTGGACANRWGWTFVSGPVTVVCSVLTEPAERVTVAVKVTGGQHHCWRNTAQVNGISAMYHKQNTSG